MQEQLEEELRLHGSPMSPATASLAAMMFEDFGVGPGPGQELEQGLHSPMAGGGPGDPSSPALHDAAVANVNDANGATMGSPTAEGRRRASSAAGGIPGDSNNAGNSIHGSPLQSGGGSVSPSRSPSLRPPPLSSQPSPSGKGSNMGSPLRGPTGAGASSPSPSSKGGGGGGWSPESKSVAIAAASPSSSKKNSPSKGSGGGSLVVSAAGGGPAPASGSSPSNKGPLSRHGSKTLLSINGTDNKSIVSGAGDGVQQASPTSSAHLALLEGQGLDAGSSLTTLHEGSSLAAGGGSSSSKGSGKGRNLPPKEERDEDAEQLFQSFEGCFLHPDAIEQVIAKKEADETCVLLAFTIPSLQMGMNYRVKVGRKWLACEPCTHTYYTHIHTHTHNQICAYTYPNTCIPSVSPLLTHLDPNHHPLASPSHARFVV